MAGENDNGKLGQMPMPPAQVRLEDIAVEVRVALMKDGGVALSGPMDNLPLMLRLLSEGVAIAGELVAQALPQRIIPVSAPLPPGAVPFGRAGQ